MVLENVLQIIGVLRKIIATQKKLKVHHVKFYQTSKHGGQNFQFWMKRYELGYHRPEARGVFHVLVFLDHVG